MLPYLPPHLFGGEDFDNEYLDKNYESKNTFIQVLTVIQPMAHLVN